MNASLLANAAAGAASILAILLTAFAWTAVRRLRVQVSALGASVADLKTELELLASISATTGRQVMRIESSYTDVVERVDVVEARGPATTSGSLDQAIEWARRGAATDKLSEQFGLSAGEADLVARLHGRPQSA
jgi:hypothetical protein